MVSVYPVLIGEMAKRNVKSKDVASALKISPRSLYSKLTGKTDFKLGEATMIQSAFFPDMDTDTLFQNLVKEEGWGETIEKV